MILFLDIVSHSGCIALIKEGECVHFEHLDHQLRDHELVPKVEEILKNAGRKPALQSQSAFSMRGYEQLTKIACVIGPGGFTSLRIAAAYANTLIDQLKIPACGVHVSDLCRARSKDDVYWLHATKKDQVFVRKIAGAEDRDLPLQNVELLSLDDLKNTIPKNSLWCGELLDAQKEELASLELEEAELQSLEEVLPAFCESLEYEQKPLEPWYGREG